VVTTSLVLPSIVQDVGTRDNKPLNLVLLEVTHHLLKDQCPEKIALAIHALSATNNANTAADTNLSNSDASGDVTATASARPNASAATAAVAASKKKLREANRLAASGGVSLKQKLLAQKYSGASEVVPQSRHSHFGGVLRLQGSNGANQANGRAATLASNPLQATTHGPFQGSAVVAKADRRKKTFNAARGYHSGRTTGQESEKHIAKFCASCLNDSYQVKAGGCVRSDETSDIVWSCTGIVYISHCMRECCCLIDNFFLRLSITRAFPPSFPHLLERTAGVFLELEGGISPGVVSSARGRSSGVLSIAEVLFGAAPPQSGLR